MTSIPWLRNRPSQFRRSAEPFFALPLRLLRNASSGRHRPPLASEPRRTPRHFTHRGHTTPITFPGTQQWVLPEINSPSHPSQFCKSALKRCMAPGRPGTHHSRRPSRGHCRGCCLKSTVRQIRRNSANPHCKGAWHLAALRFPGSGGTSPSLKPIALPESLHLVVRGHTTASDLPGDTATSVAGNQQSVRSVAIRQIRAAKVHGT